MANLLFNRTGIAITVTLIDTPQTFLLGAGDSVELVELRDADPWNPPRIKVDFRKHCLVEEDTLDADYKYQFVTAETPPPKPAWQSNRDAPRCKHCNARFSSTKRRHHCRGCGGIFCKACSSSTVNTPLTWELGKRAQRMCGQCAQTFAEFEVSCAAPSADISRTSSYDLVAF